MTADSGRKAAMGYHVLHVGASQASPRATSERAATRARSATGSRVGVRELRQNLSIYLERVKLGEVLTVTDRGHDVALLRPLAPATDIVERLAAEGRVRKPTRALAELPRPLRIEPEKSLSQVLIDMRDEERY
jgi:prevent-host-death family protein